MKRREFLKGSTWLIASTGAVGASMAGMGFSQAASAQGMLEPNAPNAVALGYAKDHSQVDTDRWPKKAGDTGATQRCSSCALFSNQGDGVGNCSIFGAQKVAAQGWCNAWTAKQ